MRNPRHVALALTVVAIWGVNFVAIGSALEGFPPILLAALRFALTSLAAFFVPRPKDVPWRWIAAVGMFTLCGQYSLLFTAMSQGMPEGLSSLVVQVQVPITVLVAAIALHERTTARQLTGIAVAAVGLGVIGVGRGGGVPLGALLLCLASGASWGIGNVCMRRAKADNGFALLVWASVYATPPLILLSLLTEGPHRIGTTFAHLHLAPIAALLFVVGFSTLIGMGIWVMLLSKYTAGSVVPYALGVPPIGLISAAVLHGEHANAVELGGAAVVLAGLVAIVWTRSTVASAPAPDSAPHPPKPSVVPATVREVVSH